MWEVHVVDSVSQRVYLLLAATELGVSLRHQPLEHTRWNARLQLSSTRRRKNARQWHMTHASERSMAS